MIAEFIALATVLTGIIAYAIRLEGRLNAHDQLFVERKEQTDTAEASIDARLSELKADLKERLVRIESKLDNIAYGTAFPKQ